MDKRRLLGILPRAEKVLGHKIDLSRIGSVRSLYDLPVDLFADAKKLTKSHFPFALFFVNYFIADDVPDDILYDFVDEVIRGGAPIHDWGTLPAICYPEFREPRELLQSTATDLLAPLTSIQGERWYREKPLSLHFGGLIRLCAPGVVIKRVNYTWRSPAGTSTTTHNDSEDIEEVTDVEEALARWIAGCAAWELTEQKINMEHHDGPREIVSALGTSLDNASPLGIRALSGLAKENATFGMQAPVRQADYSTGGGHPGFRGPSDWYRSRSE